MSEPAAVADRVVELIADLGPGRRPRRRYGSGMLLSGRWVLTAAHVVDGAVAIRVRGPDKVLLEVSMGSQAVGDPDRCDLALVEVPGADDLPAVPIARVDRGVIGGELVRDCWAVGYPAFRETDRGDGRSRRDTVHVHGTIAPLSGLVDELLSLQVDHGPPPESLDRSAWRGMSGAAVFSGRSLIGVVTEHATKRGQSDITVTPLDRLADPDHGPDDALEWWGRLGVADPDLLPRLPRRLVRSGPGQAQIRSLMANYRQAFAGRRPHLEALDAFLDDPTRSGVLLYEPSGLGKTSLLVAWVDRVAQRPGWATVFVPVSRRFDTATTATALGSLAGQLATVHGESLPGPTEGTDQLRALIDRLLRRPLVDGRKLLVVVDGLDEAVGWKVTPSLLGVGAGDHLKLVVSARHQANTSRRVWLERLGWRSANVGTIPSLATLSPADIISVMNQRGLGALAADRGVVDDVVRVTEGDPVTVSLVTRNLQDDPGRARQLNEQPAGLEAYFRSSLLEIIDATGSDAVKALLGLCAVAYGPLTHDDLAALDPERLADQSDRRRAVVAVDRYLTGDGDHIGYDFQHPRLQELYHDTLLGRDERTRLRERLIDYGYRCYTAPPSPFPSYVARFWTGHLADAGRWDTLEEVLLSQRHQDGVECQPWAALRRSLEGSYAGYSGDLAMLMDHAKERVDAELAFHCTLMATSIRSSTRFLPARLPALMASVAEPSVRWSPAAALAYIDVTPSSYPRATALVALAEAVDELPMDATLEVATRRIDRDTWALVQIAPHLDEVAAAKAVSISAAVIDDAERARVLAALAPRLGPAERDDLIVEALTLTMSSSDVARRAATFEAVAPHLSTDMLRWSFKAATSMGSSQARAKTLTALAPHLPDEFLGAALAAARGIATESDRSEALQALAPRWPEALLPEVLTVTLALPDGPGASSLDALAPRLDQTLAAKAVGAASAIALPQSRALALAALAARLPDEGRRLLLHQALAAATSPTCDWWRSELVEVLVPQLDPPRRAEALNHALALAARPDVAEQRQLGHALEALAGRLDDAQLASALEMAAGADDPRDTRLALAALSDHLPAELLAEALTIAEAIPYPRLQAEALTDLAPRLDNPSRTRILLRALDAATTTEVGSSAAFLAVLAPHLCDDERADTVTDALTLADDGSPWVQASVYAGLAPHVGEPTRSDLHRRAVEAARRVDSEIVRIRSLAAIAARIPPPHRNDAVFTALAAIRRLDESSRPAALQTLAPVLDGGFVSGALDIADSIDFHPWHVAAVAALATRIPEPQRAAVFDAAFNRAMAIGRPRSRAQAFAALACHLPAERRDRAVEIALERAAWHREYEYLRLDLLARITPCLPDSFVDRALEAAEQLSDFYRSVAVAVLAPAIPEPGRSAALDAALVAASAISADGHRARALAALASHLPEPQRGDALARSLTAAGRTEDSVFQYATLTSLASQLDQDIGGPAFVELCEAMWRKDRTSLLRELMLLAPWLQRILSPEQLGRLARAVAAVARARW